MTEEQLFELEPAAKAATPGPWHIKRGYCLYDERDMHVVSAWENYSGNKEMTIDCEEAYANARFLELTNPVAILELIAELRQTRKERDWLVQTLEDEQYCGCILSCEEQDIGCEECDRYSKENWLKAAKEATCQK